MFTVRLWKKFDKTVKFKFTINNESGIYEVIGSNLKSVNYFPLNFPVNKYFFELCVDESNQMNFSVEIKLSSGHNAALEFIIEDGKVYLPNSIPLEKLPEKLENSLMEERKQIACELFMSDEDFAATLSEKDNFEELIEKGEEMAKEVALKTIYIDDEDIALQLINYFVTAAPDSVQNQILNR
ncbi:MAG: hypothetical protein WC002_09185 [Candidatus Muiribacteriota bacterium]